jgi:2-polyprenyl-3-methyl-5-hydroxy-6-metoxy-1,4-benzoquinol methylase
MSDGWRSAIAGPRLIALRAIAKAYARCRRSRIEAVETAWGCPLCGAIAPRWLLRKNGFDIVRCGDCGLGYISPMPTREQLAELYNEAARRGETHTVAFERYVGVQRAGHIALARQVLAVIDRATGRRGDGATGRRGDGLEDEDSPSPASCRLPHLGARGRLLDVGCAAGFLLEEARRQGWEVRGVELSRDLGEYARAHFGLDVFVGELTEAGLRPASFDVVTVIGTIEHVLDPRGLLRECCRVLVPGGLLVVLTENLENAIVRYLPRAWNGFMPPEHLYHFTPETLSRLLGEFGLGVVSIVPIRSQLRAAIGGLVTGRKELLKSALDEMPTSGAAGIRSQCIRAAYSLADGVWSRVGPKDRMIVVART